MADKTTNPFLSDQVGAQDLFDFFENEQPFTLQEIADEPGDDFVEIDNTDEEGHHTKTYIQQGDDGFQKFEVSSDRVMDVAEIDQLIQRAIEEMKVAVPPPAPHRKPQAGNQISATPEYHWIDDLAQDFANKK